MLMDPNTIPGSAAGDVSGSRSISAGNTSIDTIGTMLDISLDTAVSSGGAINIILPYAESNIPAGITEEELKMVHFTGNQWVTENNCTVNVVSNTITCTVTTLSPFGIGAESSGSSGGSSGGSGRTGVNIGGNTNSVGSPTSAEAIARLQEIKNNATLQNSNYTNNKIIELDVTNSNVTNNNQSQNNDKLVVSPRQQILNGVSHDDIICNEMLQLVFKLSDGSPACVKEQSIPKLIQCGWIKITV